jgi:phosphatidylglycerol:prolipoprotein diacylglycerol transferase
MMMVVGVVLGIWRATRMSKKLYNIEPDRVYDLALVSLFSGILGSRVVYIMLNPGSESWQDFFAVWQGGLSFQGGLIAALLIGYIYKKCIKLSYWKCADLLVPSVAIGYAFTRIGCFLNGCCYGCPTHLPWAVRFSENGILTPPSHPTQIYAFFASILIFFILTRLEKMNRAPGFISVSYFGLYGVYRFLIEFLRSGYSAEVWRYGITQAQLASIAMVLVSAIVIFIFYRRPVKAV